MATAAGRLYGYPIDLIYIYRGMLFVAEQTASERELLNK